MPMSLHRNTDPMDDETDSPEPLSFGPPAPQEPPTSKPSLQDVLFGNDRDQKYFYDDENSLTSLDDALPLPDAMPVDPPREIDTDKQDVISVSEDTFFEERSLEARIHRSLRQGPTSTRRKRLMHPPSDGIAQEAKLERILEQTQQKLMESHFRVLKLSNENEKLQEECKGLNQRLTLSDTMHRSMENEEIGRLQRTIESLTCQNERLQLEAKASTQRSKALEEEKERLAETTRFSQHERNEAQMECSKLKKELEASQSDLADNERLKSMMEGQLCDSRQQIDLLEEKVESTSRSTVSNVTLQLKMDRVNEECKELQTSFAEVSLLLDAKSQAYTLLMAKNAELEESLKRPPVVNQEVQTDPVLTRNKEAGFEPLHMKRPYTFPGMAQQSESIAPPRISSNIDSSDGNSLFDRLSRIRESAEKASLMREHKNEILRIQSEHEAEIAALQKEFDEEKARLSEEYDAEMTHRINELKRRLVTEYEKKLDESERKNTKTIQRIRDETDRQCSAASQSVEAVTAELVKTNSLFERETFKRHELEIQIGKLEAEHASEKERVIQQFEKRIQAVDADWQEEKNLLLTSVQSECHKIIEEARQRPLSTKHKSPHLFVTTTPKVSTSTSFFPAQVSPLTQPETLSKSETLTQGEHSKQSDKIEESPIWSLSELSRSLMETEAMVQQVLRNDGT